MILLLHWISSKMPTRGSVRTGNYPSPRSFASPDSVKRGLKPATTLRHQFACQCSRGALARVYFPTCYTDDMSSVSPVFTEYEHQVIRELAQHRVQPNAVQRLLETAGRPMARLLNSGRQSNSRALRGLADQIHEWIEEGLIKAFRAANKLANTKDIARRYAARGINIGDNFESLRYMPLSKLDAVADSFRFGSTLLLGVEGALLG